MRAFSYVDCECGMLVRCTRIVEGQAAAQLRDANAVGYVGGCPNCKSAITITSIVAALVVKPSLEVVKG